MKQSNGIEEIKRNMKRIGNIYEKMCDKSLIEAAIRNAAKGKSNRLYIKKVLDDIDTYIDKIYQMLIDNDISLSESTKQEIFDSSCLKKRIITIPKFFPDQILHWVLMIVLAPIISKGMYRYSCGSVPNRGGIEAKQFVEKAIKDPTVRYVAKVDIAKFFNNIDTGILLDMFRRKIKDEKVINFIAKILDNGGAGLPIGYYTSQWFSNFYLEALDHYIKETLGVKYYVRYVDDMVLIDTNKRKLYKALKLINEFLAKIGLKLKADWQLWKLHSRPIDFVGFRFYKDKTLLRKRIFFRLCRRVRNVKKSNYITIHQAMGLLSLLGWLSQIEAYKYYKKNIEQYAPKNKLKKIISNNAKRRGGQNYASTKIQFGKMVTVC